VYLKLCRKLLEAVGRNDSLGNLPFVFLPCRKIRLLVAGVLCLTQKSMGDGFHLTGVEIQKGGGLLELHLQSVDDVFQTYSRGHSFERPS